MSKAIDESMIKQLYYSYVHPHLKYGIEVYGSADRTHLDKLQIKQNKLLKILSKKSYRYSSTTLHTDLDIPKVNSIYKNQILTFVYKQQNQLLPEIFENTLQQNLHFRERSTRQDSHLHISRFRSSVGEKSVKVKSAKLWNKLPSNIRNLNSLSCFKRSLKPLLHVL